MSFGADTALVTTLSGLLIVFSVLVLLVGIIKLFGIVFSGEKKNKNKPQKEPQQPVQAPKAEPPVVLASSNDDDEIIAVISAAVYAYSQSENKNYRIKSVKPVNTTHTGRPAWAAAGVAQNTKPF